jgi:hypothetical protein
MTNEYVETMKADAKKTVSDLGKIMSHAKADARADVEKTRARFGHDDEAGKKAAYAKADMKADVEKARADVANKLAHEKADAVKANSHISHIEIQEGP